MYTITIFNCFYHWICIRVSRCMQHTIIFKGKIESLWSIQVRNKEMSMNLYSASL